MGFYNDHLQCYYDFIMILKEFISCGCHDGKHCLSVSIAAYKHTLRWSMGMGHSLSVYSVVLEGSCAVVA